MSASLVVAIASLAIAVSLSVANFLMVRELRASRRYDPRLQLFNGTAANYGDSLGYSVILVNPGLVPIVVTENHEQIAAQHGQTLETKGDFSIGQFQDPEQQFVITALPWAIPPNSFALWRRELRASDGLEAVLFSFVYFAGDARRVAESKADCVPATRRPVSILG